MTKLTIEVSAELSDEQIQLLQEGIIYNLNAIYDTQGVEGICPHLHMRTIDSMHASFKMCGQRFPFNKIE